MLIGTAAGGRDTPLADDPGPRDTTLKTVAFGSCLRQWRPQPVWDSIQAAQPGLFIALGDNVYADTLDDPVFLARQYARLGDDPGYRRLSRSVPVLATWDDHDYGANDAGREYPLRETSKALFLSFYDVPHGDPVWDRPGIYRSAAFGPESRRVQVILLDTRSFRGPLTRGRAPGCTKGHYVPGRDDTVPLLGEAQWRWLEHQLTQPARLRLIVSSIQVLPVDHCWEKWANLPHERARLLRLIADTRAQGVVFLSGDRHLAEISRLDPGPAGYPLYEITSSGLNSSGAGKGETNRFRITDKNFRRDNFGVIAIHWGDDPELALEVRDVRGRTVMEERVPLASLTPTQ